MKYQFRTFSNRSLKRNKCKINEKVNATKIFEAIMKYICEDIYMGPDALTTHLYLLGWDIIGKDVICEAKTFLIHHT